MTIKEAHAVMEDLQRIFTQYRFIFSDKLAEANGLAILALEKQMEQPTIEPEIVITPEEFKELMAHIAETDNEEARHYEMDCCMVELLNLLGYEEGIKIFKSTDKWFS